MSKTLEGYVDDGKAAPLANVSTVVTVVGAGTVVTSGVTDSDGHWYFDGLDEGPEYFVNVIDVDGNAVVRGPWSGEVRDVWVRDRLAIPDTAQAALPNGGNTTVGGLPLALSPEAGNALEWRATGLFADTTAGLSQAEADLLYEPIDTAYTKAEADALFLTEAAADLLYSPIDAVVDAYTKAESDARYAELTDVDPFPQYLTPAEASATYLTPAAADALFLTQAEGDARYDPLGGGGGGVDLATGDARWVNVTGDTLTGDLTFTSPAKIAAPVKGHLLGLKGGTGFNANVLPADASIKIYEDAGGWAGFGVDNSGVAWFRTGTTAAVLPTFALGTDGSLLVQRGMFYAQAGATVYSFLRVGTTDPFALYTDVATKLTSINRLTDPALPVAYASQPGLMIQHEGSSHIMGLSLGLAMNGASAERLNFWRTRGTWASKVAIANGDYLMSIEGWGWSGSQWLNATAIRAYSTGTITTTAVPGTLSLETADSAGTLAARMSIGPDGSVNVLSSSATTLTLRGLTASDNVQLRFKGGASAVDQWAIGNEIATGAVGRNFDIYDLVAGANRLRITSAGLVGIGAKADGTAVATLEVQPTTASYAFVVRAHASTVDTVPFFLVTNKAPVGVLGANNLGWVTDKYAGVGVAATAHHVSYVVSVYSSAGTFLGYIRLFSTTA